MSHIFNTYKLNYELITKAEKKQKKSKMLSEEYETIHKMEIANNFADLDLKKIFFFKFQDDDISSIFKNNPRYLDSQIKGSFYYNNLMKSVRRLNDIVVL